MTRNRVLEIEQAEMRDAAPSLDQHDILGMIVAQRHDRPETIRGDRLQDLAPGLFKARDVHLRANRRTIPVGEQAQLLKPLVEAVRLEVGHRRMIVKMNEHIGGKLIKLALPLRVVVQELAQAAIAEIAQQKQAAIKVPRKDVGRA